MHIEEAGTSNGAEGETSSEDELEQAMTGEVPGTPSSPHTSSQVPAGPRVADAGNAPVFPDASPRDASGDLMTHSDAAAPRLGASDASVDNVSKDASFSGKDANGGTSVADTEAGDARVSTQNEEPAPSDSATPVATDEQPRPVDASLPPAPDAACSGLACGDMCLDPGANDERCGASDCSDPGEQCLVAEICMAAACREWSAPAALDIGDAALEVVVGASEDGATLAAAWLEVEDRGDGNGTLSRLFARVQDANGGSTTWLSEAQVMNAHDPQIAVTKDGQQAIVVWAQDSKVLIENTWKQFHTVWAALWDGANWTLSTTSIDSEGDVFPKVAFSAEQAAFVVWTRDVRLTADDAAEHIWEQKLEAAAWDGANWAPHDVPTSEGIFGAPLIALAESGTAATIVWQDRHSNPQFELPVGEVRSARLTVDGVQVGPVSEGVRESLKLESLSVTSEADVAVVLWSQLDRDTDGDVTRLYSSVGAVGSWLTVALSGQGNGSVSNNPAAVSADGTEIRLAWSQRETRPSDGEDVTWAHTASWDGAEWVGEVLSPAEDNLYGEPSVAISADGSVALVLWVDNASDSIRAASGTTNEWVLSTMAQVANPEINSIVVAPNGKSAVAAYNTYDYDIEEGVIHSSLWNGVRWHETRIEGVSARLVQAWLSDGAKGTWVWIAPNSDELETVTFARLR